MTESTYQATKRAGERGPKGDDPRTREINASKGKHRRFYEGEARRKTVLEAVAGGSTVKDAVSMVGVRYATYEAWRKRFPHFAAQIDTVRNRGRNPGPPDGSPRQINRSFDIAQERRRWFGHDTPAFQMLVLQALLDTPPGGVLMVLFPPEHGKTTCYEDFKTIDIAYNPQLLNHVASESQALSRKILSKIRNRLDPSGQNQRMTEFVTRYGPFAPQGGDRSTQQPWAATHFDVWRKGEFDDRDYTMAALGFGSQVIGSRSNHLHCDDLQSRKSLGRTEKMFGEFQQDWLSRPGEVGFTSVFGNRVDDGDIYQAIEENIDPDILRIIRFPAILPNGEPLWPERWSLAKLDRMKRKTRVNGTFLTWERNWMQAPRSKHVIAFSDELVEKNFKSDLSLRQPKPDDGRVCYLSLDPAIQGRTAIMGVQVTHAGRIRPVYIADLPGLGSNETIMTECRLAIEWLVAHGLVVTDWVIEAKNFQAGLSRDERLLEIAAEFGCSVREHMTGTNKYDENVGVPSMVSTFVKGEIEIPYADDPETRVIVDELKRQLVAWRPGKGGGGTASAAGNRLRQDLVMALWFAWIRWRELGKNDTEERAKGTGTQFKYQGLPYAPHQSGLMVPTSYTPTMLGAGR